MEKITCEFCGEPVEDYAVVISQTQEAAVCCFACYKEKL